MAKTVVGLFDTAPEAQRVVEDLVKNGIPRDNISVMASHTEGRTSSENVDDTNDGSRVVSGAGIGATVGGIGGLLVGLAVLPIPGFGPVLAMGPIATTLAGMGIGAATGSLIGALTSIGVPEEHAEHYAEGVRRGGTLVSVNAPDAIAQTVSEVMNRHNAVNIHERAAAWRQASSVTDDRTARPMVSGAANAAGAVPYATQQPAPQAVARTTERTNARGEVTVPVVEESLRVGKREVARGGVQVSARTVETPVTESVQLHEEHVRVERRPVDRAVGPGDQAFREGTMEFKERAEEAVVAKNARVVEEVVVHKDVSDRTEVVRETLKHTEVDVNQLSGTAARGFEVYDSDFRNDYQRRFASSGINYQSSQPAYRYGYDLATDPRYVGRDWDALETDARRDWESRGANVGPWERFKDAVRFAWDRARGDRMSMPSADASQSTRRSDR